MVVVGGGAGGCSIAAKFAGKLGEDQCAVIEPSDVSLLIQGKILKKNLLWFLLNSTDTLLPTLLDFSRWGMQAVWKFRKTHEGCFAKTSQMVEKQSS